MNRLGTCQMGFGVKNEKSGREDWGRVGKILTNFNCVWKNNAGVAV